MRRLLAAALLACAVVAALAAAPALPARPPARLLVTATEFRLVLSRPAVAHGRVIVQLADRGMDAHDLALQRLDGRGRAAGRELRVPLAQAGELKQASLTLARGRWRVWCTLPGHERMGMRATLRVA